MTLRLHSITFVILFASLILQGCSSVKKTLGIDRNPPEEYAVSPSLRPLDMPPDFTYLPPPTPGMERPQDIAARQNQKEKLIGPTGNKQFLTPGEKALLEMSQSHSNQDNVRQIVDTEAHMEKQEEQTVIQRLGLKKTKPKGEAINPYEETQELEKLGIPATPPVRTESIQPLTSAPPPSSQVMEENITSSGGTSRSSPLLRSNNH